MLTEYKQLHTCYISILNYIPIILFTKITAAQNEVALSYLKVRGLYFLAVFAAAIYFSGTRGALF